MTDNELVADLIDQISGYFAMFGMPEVSGRIWATIHFKGPLTQDQLKDSLNISISQISQTLSHFENLGLVKKTKKDRKNLYETETSIGKVLKKKCDYALRFYIDPMRVTLKEKSDQASDKELKDRINKMKTMYDRSAFMLKLFAKGLQK